MDRGRVIERRRGKRLEGGREKRLERGKGRGNGFSMSIWELI